MDDFLDKLLKIQSEYFKRVRLLFILDLISIFSIFYSIFIIFNIEYFLEKSSLNLPVPIPPVLAFIIAISGALLLHRNDHKINTTLVIEDKYPELREKLRTAYDNRNETNVIVESLKNLVSSGLAVVSASKLLATGVIVAKILITVIFILVATTVLLNPDKYVIPPDAITNVTNTLTGNTGTGTNESIDVPGRPEDLYKAGTEGGGNIRGKPRIASIEGKNIDLTIYSGTGSGFEVRPTNQTQNQFIRSAEFPVDVLGSNVSDGGYSILMKKTETEKELINKYAVERSKI